MPKNLTSYFHSRSHRIYYWPNRWPQKPEFCLTYSNEQLFLHFCKESKKVRYLFALSPFMKSPGADETLHYLFSFRATDNCYTNLPYEIIILGIEIMGRRKYGDFLSDLIRHHRITFQLDCVAFVRQHSFQLNVRSDLLMILKLYFAQIVRESVYLASIFLLGSDHT